MIFLQPKQNLLRIMISAPEHSSAKHSPDSKEFNSAANRFRWVRFLARRFAIGILFVLLTASAAPAQNKVLELDGAGSYVELPPDLFKNLTQATVEVWARWDSFRTYSRVFEFGAAWQSINVFNHANSPDLRFNLYPKRAQNDPSLMFSVRTNGVLRLNEWIHIAAVSGPGGMELYANGVFVGDHTNAASFADINVVHTNLFGRGMARNPTDQDFRGQMDEVRIWDHRRTPTQIREHMRKRLTGKEPGLAGLWNFEDGTARDSVHGYRGRFIGNARVVTADSTADSRLIADEPPPTAQILVVPPTGALASATPDGQDAAAWWIAAALTAIAALLVWLVLMLRRSGVGSDKLIPAGAAPALLTNAGQAATGTSPSAQQELKDRALADLTEFAKQSLVQGLYSQRKALLEAQQKAQQELAALEGRLVALHLPDRIQAYEKRIAELEKQLESRSDEVRELTSATLLLLRQKLEEERQLERKASRFQ